MPNRPGIAFGLAAVRNVGESLVDRIVAEREANGPFADFYDFCRRVDPMVLNKRTMDSLAKAGAFDSLGVAAPGLVFGLRRDRGPHHGAPARARRGHRHPFLRRGRSRPGGDGDAGKWEGTRLPIPETEFDKSQRLAFEKEMLGLYVSDHPLMGLEPALKRHTDCSLAEMRDAAGSDGPVPGLRLTGSEGSIRSVGGVVTDLKRSYTKRGDLMARFVLEDLQASMEVFVFPKTMAEYGALLENDAVVVLQRSHRPARRPAQDRVHGDQTTVARVRFSPGSSDLAGPRSVDRSHAG